MKDTNTDDARGAMIELRIDTGRIAELALLSEKTELVGPSDCAGIIAPETEGFQECAVCLRDELATLTGTQLPLLGDTFALDATCLPRNIIALGHAGNNTLLRRLHYLGYFSHGDYSETGLRVVSIHNPFGDGHNVLAVLGTTAKACARGSERLLERLSCTDGRWGIDERLFEVEPRPETPDPQKLLDEADARDPGSYAGRPGAFLTALNHLNSAGEERWARAFIQLVTPYATGEAPLSFWLMSAVDFWTDTLVIAWDKAEAFSYFSDDERLLVANFIASCTEYCHDSITYQKWRITEDEHQVFNHHTFPAKGLYFGCMHLRRHGYEVVDIDAWLAKSSQVFDRASRGGRSFDEGGGGYSWLVGNHLLQVCLAQGDTSYARSEKMLRYADLAITIQNNRFDLVPFGDCGGYHTRGDNAANILLRAAEWHGDSGLKWVAEQSAPAVVAADVFTRELRSAPPEKHVGLFVLPLEPVVHQWTDLPRFPNYPPPVRLTNVPVEKCFDKFSFRGGWGADDDYVLVQGFGDGQHGHPDANSISQYQVGGRLFLVDNDYIRRMPKQHNTIMVIRDGGHDPVPVTARLDFAGEFSGGALTQSVLVDYNGCDWTRRLLWLKGDCLLAIDMLEAREAGDYELRCYWRTLGSADSTEHGMHAEHDGEHFHVIELTGSDRRLDLECLPLNSTEYPKYNYGEGSPKVLCEKRVLHLSAGEKVCFVNLLLPNANAESPRRSVRWDDADGIVLDGEGISVTARPGSVEVDGREELTLPEEHRLLVEQNAGTSTAARPASIQRSGLAEVWRLQLPGVATCFAPMEDGGALVGCDDGTVGVVNSTGDFCQFYQATGRIGAVHAGRLFGESEVTCLATGDDAQLRFFRTDGEETLSVSLPRCSHMPAWGRALCLADLDGDGTLWPVVGTAAWRVHAVAPDGTFRWTFQTAAHAVTCLAVADLNKDGREEIAAGTVYFCVPAVTADGERLWQDEDYNDYWRAGPWFRHLAVGDVDGDGELEVVAASCDTLVHCIDHAGAKKWTYSIGDDPMGLQLLPQGIAVASQTGDVHLIDGHGERIWRTKLGSPCTALTLMGDGLCVADEGRGLVKINAQGIIIGGIRLPAPACQLATLMNGDILAATTDGTVLRIGC